MNESPKPPFEPAAVVAARAIVSGERPPAYCVAYLPRGAGGRPRRNEELTPYWRPEQWWEQLRGYERWKQCVNPSTFAKEAPEYNWALTRGEVRALQEHWCDTLHSALLLLRKLAESEQDPSIPGLGNERLRLRLVLAVHKELREILAEWDFWAASTATVISPDAKKPEWIPHLESFEMEGGVS